MHKSSARKITFTAVLFALCVILAYVEELIGPLPFLPPGVKLGLANIPIMYALFFVSAPSAFLMAVLKSLFIFLLKGFTAAALTFLGSIASVFCMWVLSRIRKPRLSYLTLSIAGAVMHNLGQLLGVWLLISRQLTYYLPVLILSGLVMGFLTGMVLKFLLPALDHLHLNKTVSSDSSRSLKCLLLILCLLLSSCSSHTGYSDPAVFTWYDLFDTYSSLTIYGEDTQEASQAADGLYEVLWKFHQETDIYHTYEGLRNLCSMNQANGSAVSVDQELFDFLTFAKDACSLSDGTVNILLGSVTSLWEETRRTAVLPDESALAQAMKHTDISTLLLDEDTLTVTLSDPESRLDAGALAKGYALRLAKSYLSRQGIENYLLSLGGSILVHGSPLGTGRDKFIIGLQDPKKPEGTYSRTVTMEYESCATSGDYQRYVDIDGVRYHHIIDPSTGYPSTRHHSVTVFCDDPALADVLSTALFCMTQEDGQALASSLQAEAVYQDEE